MELTDLGKVDLLLYQVRQIANDSSHFLKLAYSAALSPVLDSQVCRDCRTNLPSACLI